MLAIHLKDNNVPLYIQIYEYIKAEIRNGNLKANFKLPSKRQLSSHINVSINTIDYAYSQLISEGYIFSKPKSGYFVCQIDKYMHVEIINKNLLTKQPEQKPLIDFSPSHVDRLLFPFNLWRKLFKDCFNEYDDEILKKPNRQGDITLRKTLVNFLHSSRGVECDESQIVIGTGTSNILQILCLILGRNKCIAFENPVYLQAYKIFKEMGNEVISIDIDKKGVVAESLEKLEKVENGAVYITPSHHFPLGFSMPIDRRIKLLNVANRKNLYIIEDDYDSEFRYSGRPLPSLQSIDKNEKVIYIGTFTRSIAPSVRIGYMVLPKPLLEIYSQKEIGMSVSLIEQKIISKFITDGYFERHLNKMRKAYKDKRQFLINCLNENFDLKITGENAGHHILISLKNQKPTSQLYSLALKNGVRVYPVSNYFVGEVPAEHKNKLLLGYGGLTEKEIKEGVLILKKAWLA